MISQQFPIRFPYFYININIYIYILPLKLTGKSKSSGNGFKGGKGSSLTYLSFLGSSKKFILNKIKNIY
jgi:hypothetical protein